MMEIVALIPCLILLVPALLAALWLMGTYNGLVRLRNHVRESWSGIDTELKRRYELIPNLVEAVKAYAAHEERVLREVTEARARAAASQGSPAAQARDENELVHATQRLLAVAEAYPDLKASEHFLKLQHELVNTEDRIQAARRFYNANVRDLNTRIEMFPSSLVAHMGGFQPAEYFEVDAAARAAPSLAL
jgi:LemA protein